MAFTNDRFIPLTKRGDVRPSKLSLFDDVIRAMVNSIRENEAFMTALLINVLISMLQGGSSSEKAQQQLDELRERGENLIKMYEETQTISLKEVISLFSDVMRYLNKEHNYLFVKRTETADEEDFLSEVVGDVE